MPLVVVPSCLAPPLSVASGSPRSHAPVVAVSVVFGLVVQPVAVSKSSENTVVTGVLVTANTRSSRSLKAPAAHEAFVLW